MSGINETATVTLNVNGAQAKQMMSELDTKIKATEQTIEELKNKIKDPKALENAQNQLNDYNTRLWAVMDNAARTKTAINEMKASGASPEELEAAKSQLKKYSTEIGHLKRAVKDAKTELDKFEPKTLEKARKELSSYKKQLEGIKSATEGVTQALGSLDTATPRQLEKALRTLNKQLKGLTPGTEVWNSHVEQIQSLKARLAELKDEIDGQQSAWSRFQDWALGAWPAIDLLQQWGGNAFDIMRGAVDAYADMDQEMANVRKFTGMTAEAVDDLNVEFKKIDTRTSRENLNKLAQEAGRLGKTSKDDILGFVKAADKINVALDDLGSDATLKLSKLTGVFGDESRYGTEQSLLKVGSVINELSQNCSASAPYLADFASRMGGVGAQANMTIPQIMAFGAVLDSNGQQVEASSTALSQVIVRMMQEPAKYAKVAGLDVKKFTQMLKTDVNSALILFLETLQKAGGMDTLSPMFKDMGENGSRAIAALSTLATHIDQVKAQQEVANVAFAEGTSIDKEFAVQNETVQASLEKAKNAVNELRVELGQRLSPLMSHMISSTSAMTRGLLTLIKFCFEYKGVILTLSATLLAYIATVKAYVAAKAIENAVEQTGLRLKALVRPLVLATSLAYYKLTKNVTKAAVAQRLLNASISVSPIGLMITAITTAIGLLWTYSSRAKKAAEEQSRLRKEAEAYKKSISDISLASEQYAQEEKSRLDMLYRAAMSEATSKQERIKASRELISLYPDYFKNLSAEDIMLGNAKDRYDDLTRSIIENARARAAADLVYKNQQEILEIEQNIIDGETTQIRLAEERDAARLKVDKTPDATGLMSTGMAQHAAYAEAMTAYVEAENALIDKGNEVQDLYDKRRALEEANEDLIQKFGPAALAAASKPQSGLTPESVENPSPTGYVSQVQADKERKKKEAEERRAAAKAKKEFKAELDSYKAQRSASDRQVLELYKSGVIEYDELLRRRHENELKYYDSSISHFQKTFSDQKDTYLQDDKDYQKLLLDREKSDEKYEQNRTALALQSINRRKNAEEQDAQHMFDVKSDPTVQDEIALQTELYRIRRTALDDKLALYTEGSKEHADVRFEIESLEKERELTLNKTYFKAVSTFREAYDKKSAAERFRLEKATLDALLKANIVSAEQYARYLKGLSDKYSSELPGSSPVASAAEAAAKYEAEKKQLQDALAEGLVSSEEFYDRLASIGEEARKTIFDGLRSSAGEWNAMLYNIADSFKCLLDGLEGSLAGTLERIGQCTAAVSAAVTAGMQVATEYAKADAEIRINTIEKRYEKEIENAQGNSYKVTKLEKEKEEKIAKIKNDVTKKQYAMQVAQAFADTAANALKAYGSAQVLPFPASQIVGAMAAAVATAQGLAQIAVIKKQRQAAEAQGYAEGGFTKPGGKYEPAGIVHAGEWVASQKLLASPVARPMIEALDYAQRTNTVGSLRPDDVSRAITANNSLVRIAENDGSPALIVAAAMQMSRTVDNLTDRLNQPFITVNTVTGDQGIKQAEDEYSRLINNKSPKSRKNAANH